MLVVFALVLVAAVSLAYLWSRESARRGELEADVAALESMLAQREVALASAEQQAAAAQRARDDALERAARAKRDATDVAKRLDDERRARAEAEQSLAEAEQSREAADDERRRLEDELAAAEADASGEGASGEGIDELWQLALADAARTWEISVSPTPGLPSPLEDADDPLRVAVEIEVDAAREDAGSVIELRWIDNGHPAPAIALQALSIARALVSALAKVADDAQLTVAASDAAVRLVVVAEDAHGTALDPAVAPEHRIGPGTYLVGNAEPVAARSA